MPRTRKHYRWLVMFGDYKEVVQSKTEKGACYKAFKKMGIKPPKANYWGQFENTRIARL